MTSIGADAFSGSDVKIYCYSNSFAHRFAVENSLDFELIGLSVGEGEMSLSEGESAALTALPSIHLACGLPIVWSSSNPAVATVAADGTVRAVSSGTATITAAVKDSGLRTVCAVSVAKRPCSVRWSVDGVETEMQYAFGSAVTPPPAPTKAGYSFLGWYTSASGGTRITASTVITGSFTAYARWVKNAASVTLSSASIELRYRQPSPVWLTAAVAPSGAANTDVVWVSSNPAAASVNQAGKVSAVGRGTATITATVTNPDGSTACASCSVKVKYVWWQWIIKILLFGWIWY